MYNPMALAKAPKRLQERVLELFSCFGLISLTIKRLI